MMWLLDNGIRYVLLKAKGLLLTLHKGSNQRKLTAIYG